MKIFIKRDQTCLATNVKESNDTLNFQEINNILGDNEGKCNLANTIPTPFIKFGMQYRVKRLFKGNKINSENKNGLKKLVGLLNSRFKFNS